MTAGLLIGMDTPVLEVLLVVRWSLRGSSRDSKY
jgi:hypothetical protein